MTKMTDSRAAGVLDRLALGSEEPDVHAALARAIARLREPAEAQVPSYDALLIIAQSVCGALERAGITDCDDPGEAIDVLRERYEAQAQGGGEVIQRHVVTKYRDGSVHVADVAEPPSAPVGVSDDYRKGWEAGRTMQRALAQQPAAVDGGVAQRAAKALLETRSYIGPERPDDPDDVDSAEWWDELTELAAALAAQPGGSDNDR